VTGEHGTAGRYNNSGCRCGDCTAAASAARAAWLESLQDRLYADVPHGTASGYRNWACRCDPCRAAGAAARRKARQPGERDD
jgi:hypothetical protein